MSSHIPPGFSALTPYLHLEAPAEFIAFAQNAFGATVRMDHRQEGTVVHAELVIEGCTIELSAARPDWPKTRSAFHLYVSDVDAAHAQALQAGADEAHPPTDQEYGERSSAVRDAWGNHWYLATMTDRAVRTATE